MQTATYKTLNTPKTYTIKNESLNIRYEFTPNAQGVGIVATNTTDGTGNFFQQSVKDARYAYGALLNLKGTVTTHKRFTHDCDECVFLGSTKCEGRWYDLYVHLEGEGYSTRTYIGRYGNDEAYSSVSGHIHPDLYPEYLALAHSLCKLR